MPISFSPMFFVALSFISCHFLFSTLTVNAWDFVDDEALVTFLKGPEEFEQFCTKKGVTSEQSIQILAQNYGIHLGILYFMRQNWNCAEIKKETIKPEDREECDQFRQCLDKLFKYLYDFYTGKSVVKQIFFEKSDWMMIFVIRALLQNWKFYFRPDLINENDRKRIYDVTFSGRMSKFVAKVYDKFTGENKQQIEFDQKMENIFNNLKQANESQNEKELALANASAPSSSSSSSLSGRDALFMDTLLDWTPIYYTTKAEKDQQFLDFVEKDKFDNFDRNKPNYYNKYQLGFLHLVRKFFRCDNAKRNVKFFDKAQCDKFRLYLDILHEYLFRLHYKLTEGKSRPIFQLGDEIVTIMETMDALNGIGHILFGEPLYNEYDFNCYFPPKRTIDARTHYSSFKLLNENEVDYLKKKDFVGPRFDQKRKEFDEILATFAKGRRNPLWAL